MKRVLLLAVLTLTSVCASAELRGQPNHPVNLSGHWVLNTSLSDDPYALAQKWTEKYVRQMRAMMRPRRGDDPDADLGPPDDEYTVREPDPDATDPPYGGLHGHVPKPIDVHNQRVRQVLSIVPSVDITQSTDEVHIVTELSNNRYEPGDHSQITTIDGSLADSDVGWDGDVFMITRRVHGGVSVREQYRLLNQGQQLEYRLERSGNGTLSPMKLRRVFDLFSTPVLADPDVGPSR